jgi:hypothetical protein
MVAAMIPAPSTQSCICRIARFGFFSLLISYVLHNSAAQTAAASIIRDAENGIHYYCRDGNSAVIGTAKGLSIGLRGNGLLMPYSEGYWKPVPGRLGCYYRGMSVTSQQSILEAIYYYCVQERRNCF